jgi:predicted nucleotidyltransferase
LEAHEVEKFCELLIKGNPSTIETPFTDRMLWASPEWVALRDIRKEFLSRQVALQYTGYARGQLARLKRRTNPNSEDGEYNTKWAYHTLRVLGDAMSIANGGEPTVWKDGPERELLMDVRLGKYGEEQAVAMTEERLTQIASLEPWALKDDGNRVLLNEWLLWVRGLESPPKA